MSKIRLAPWQLCLAAAAFIVLTGNTELYRALGDRLDLFTAGGLGFLLAFTLLMVFVLNSIFLVFGVGPLQKPLLALFLIGSSVFGLFTNKMGVVFDGAMFQNIAETVRDRNMAEATELLSLPLLVHVLLFGVLPALLLGFVEQTRRRLLPEFALRTTITVAGLLLVVGSTLPNYKNVSFFARENNELRFKVTPIFPLASLLAVARTQLRDEKPFTVIDADATRSEMASKRTIGIMVVGETARADHFSMNGYERETNPNLGTMPDVLYGRADSCGTSTLYSVPCMFSMLGRADYSRQKAAAESNVLDILTAAGVQTVWIDNNSSCKGVCARIDNVNLRRDVDESSPYYSDMGYLDEILLESIEPYLHGEGPDLLIVLHALGSHGPAYSRRYPPAFASFAPSCDKASPTECSVPEVRNAYDNTIVYTDFVLSQIIDRLKSHSADFDAFLFYASDHGESLGENGLYLHGMPYAIAPAAQTTVPIVAWLSDDFRKRQRLSPQMLRRFGSKALSHDNISHTLLGFFDVDASSYVADLDLFATTDIVVGGTELPASY
jgi:lipid A ethanolaminephosphotransferase